MDTIQPIRRPLNPVYKVKPAHRSDTSREFLNRRESLQSLPKKKDKKGRKFYQKSQIASWTYNLSGKKYNIVVPDSTIDILA